MANTGDAIPRNRMRWRTGQCRPGIARSCRPPPNVSVDSTDTGLLGPTVTNVGPPKFKFMPRGEGFSNVALMAQLLPTSKRSHLQPVVIHRQNTTRFQPTQPGICWQRRAWMAPEPAMSSTNRPIDLRASRFSTVPRARVMLTAELPPPLDQRRNGATSQGVSMQRKHLHCR